LRAFRGSHLFFKDSLKAIIEMTCMSLREGIPKPDLAIGRCSKREMASEGTSTVERITALTNSSKSEKREESIQSVRSK
jgi:hypothetical protein